MDIVSTLFATIGEIIGIGIVLLIIYGAYKHFRKMIKQSKSEQKTKIE